MNCVYILQSSVNSKFYIGSTNNLGRRVVEHNSGKTKSLRYLRPLRLVFFQEYPTLIQARKIEHMLKRLKNRTIINKIVADGHINLGS